MGVRGFNPHHNKKAVERYIIYCQNGAIRDFLFKNGIIHIKIILSFSKTVAKIALYFDAIIAL
jgi:hypothetical protein